jgi:hypothetical protein
MSRLTVLLPVVLIAGCAVAPITSSVQASDPAAFAQARSFVVQGPPPGGLALDPALRAGIDAGLAEALQRRGYQPATGAPDLTVSWQVAPTGRIYQDAPARPALEAHAPVGPGDPYAAYRAPGGAGEGTASGLLLVTVKNAAGVVVWQATSEGAAARTASAARGARRAAQGALQGIPATSAK